jgi:hypothetical protein
MVIYITVPPMAVSKVASRSYVQIRATAGGKTWPVPAVGDSDLPWLTSTTSHCSTTGREPLPIVVAAAVLRATSPDDDGEDLFTAEGGEFDLRIQCALGVGGDHAATLRGCYAVWASSKGERGRGSPSTNAVALRTANAKAHS